MLETSFSKKGNIIKACIWPALLKLAYCLYYAGDSKTKLTYHCNGLPSRQRHCLHLRYILKKTRNNGHWTWIILYVSHTTQCDRREGKAMHCHVRSCKALCKEPYGNCSWWTVLNAISGCSSKLLPWIIWYLWSGFFRFSMFVFLCLCL